MELSDLKQVWRNTHFSEAYGSPRRMHADNRSTTQRSIYIDAQKELSAVYDFLGYATKAVNPVNGKTYVSRVTPHRDGLFPAQWCMAFGTEPWGVNEATTSRDDLYKFTKCNLDYSTPLWGILEDNELPVDAFGNPDESSLLRNCIINGAFDSSFLALNKDSMKMADYPVLPIVGKPAFHGSVGFITNQVNYNIQWLGIPKEAVRSRVVNPGMAEGDAYIDLLIGCINQVPLWGWGSGKLLLLGASFKPCFNAHGFECRDITFLFRGKKQSHDRVYWPQAAKDGKGTPLGWVQLSVNDTTYILTAPPPDGVLIYNVGTLETCFQCAP